MATSIAASPAGSDKAPLNILRLIPGILLLAVIGYAGKFLEKFLNTYAKTHHWTFPNIEYVLWAIVIGLVISNLLSVPKIFQPGIDTYEFWLKVGIVLLGSRFVLADMLKLGGISLALVIVEITLSLLLMHALGRAFHLTPKLTSLLAVGSSICGVSAIIAAKGAIDADDEDSTFRHCGYPRAGSACPVYFPVNRSQSPLERYRLRPLVWFRSR